MTPRIPIWILLTAVGAAACRPDNPSAPGTTTVRDSAGIEIVEHPAGFEAALPRWTATELVTDIGSGEGPGQELVQVRGATRLSDGRIVVADGGSSELRFYDSAGTYLLTAGRKGNGPGEFAFLAWLQRLGGDTLAVLDAQLRRVSLVAPTGIFVRSISVSRRQEQNSIDVNARLSDGRFLGTSTTFPDMRETSGPVRRDLFAVGVIAADGTGFDTVAVVPGLEMYPGIGHEGGQAFPALFDLQFGRNTLVATDGSRIYVGTNQPEGLRVYGPDGRLLRMIRSATPPEPVTMEHRQQRMRETLANFERSGGSEQLKAEWRKNGEDARYAEVFPDYERLLIGSDGTLWQERVRRAEDEGRRYVVFDSAGKAIAMVTCPDRFRPYEVGPNEIIGLWRDPDEVNHVRVYKVNGKQ